MLVIYKNYGQTINTARACLNDRIDLTLLLLKDYYEIWGTNKKPDDYSNDINKLFNSPPKKPVKAIIKAFEGSWQWLKLLKNFPGFCEYFMLKGSFVNCNYDVIDLASEGCLPFVEMEIIDFGEKNSIEYYRRYASNNVDAVKTRDKKMKDVIKNALKEGI